MILERFNLFAAELTADSASLIGVRSLHVYRCFAGDWYDQADAIVDGTTLIQALNATLERAKHWKARGSTEAFFPVLEFEAVIVASFVNSPQKHTRERVTTEISKCVVHANNEFKATHEPMTGLLNKEAFERALREAVDNNLKSEKVLSDFGGRTHAGRSVAVLALDLDFFKQVNDTYGHLFGDIVLKSLALRLENFVRETAKKGIGNKNFSLSRTGGEEFSILVSGEISATEALKLGNDLRVKIANIPLPSDQEWKYFTERDGITNLDLPSTGERGRTISVGVSTLSDIEDRSDTNRIVADLVHRADLALYRAKSAGRNTARSYSEILERCGKVLQHHPETDAVAIDIGRAVGVSPGQEFIVYHPDFIGGQPFMLDDGRTKRRLGIYPKLPLGRIVVFDAQLDVSFCHRIEPETDIKFTAESVLEAVPLGFISHLVPGSKFQYGIVNPGLTTTEALPNVVRRLVEQSGGAIVCVFLLSNWKALQEERGIFAVNQALLHLFLSIQRTWPNTRAVGQLDATQFAVIMERNSEFNSDEAKSIITAAGEQAEGLAVYKAGIFDPGWEGVWRGSAGGHQNLRQEFAIDFARYAAAWVSDEDDQIAMFDGKVAQNVIWRATQRDMPEKALSDYKKLREMGVIDAYVENAAAIAAYRAGNEELMLECMDRAVQLLPKNPTLYANRGFAHFELGHMIEAHTDFSKVESIRPNYEWPDHYLASVALATYHGFRGGKAKIGEGILVKMLEKAQHTIEDEKDSRDYADIKIALEKLDENSPGKTQK